MPRVTRSDSGATLCRYDREDYETGWHCFEHGGRLDRYDEANVGNLCDESPDYTTRTGKPRFSERMSP